MPLRIACGNSTSARGGSPAAAPWVRPLRTHMATVACRDNRVSSAMGLARLGHPNFDLIVIASTNPNPNPTPKPNPGPNPDPNSVGPDERPQEHEGN